MGERGSVTAIVVLALALVVTVLAGCGRDTVPDVDDGVLSELTAELGTRMCQRQLDSLAFEIDGIFFRSDVDITDRESLMALIPYPLPVCPVSGETYLVVDQGTVIVISCPNGHGSVEVR